MSEEITHYQCPYCHETFDDMEKVKRHIIGDHKADPLPKPHDEVEFTVNGQKYQMRVEPNWTLYHVIHDKLGFTGVKMFCDRGACGSCTVILDGRPILSCMTLAIECEGVDIQTAEGIAADNHPLIESYVNHHAMQCGYCTPGFVTTSKALLDKNPDPSEEEIKEALAGNLCRCGTYPQHPKAVREAAEVLSKQ